MQTFLRQECGLSIYEHGLQTLGAAEDPAVAEDRILEHRKNFFVMDNKKLKDGAVVREGPLHHRVKPDKRYLLKLVRGRSCASTWCCALYGVRPQHDALPLA